MDDIHGDGCKNTINGIHGTDPGAEIKLFPADDRVAWSEHGIVGRGILLDYHRWRLANNIPHEPFKTGTIPLKSLKAVAESQGTEIKFGDILIIRSGKDHERRGNFVADVRKGTWPHTIRLREKNCKRLPLSFHRV
jgi:hypothetical protein